MTDIILGAIIILPVAISFLLKSNGAIGFLTVCAGFVLSTSAVGDLKQLLNQMDLTVTETTLALVLVSAPMLLTLLLVRSPARHGPMFIMQLLAALAAGGLLALTIGPLLGESDEFNLNNSQIWKTLQDIQAPFIGAGALISFMLIWAGGFQHHRKKKH